MWDHDPIRSAMPWDRLDVGLLGPEPPGGPLHPSPESASPACAAAEEGCATNPRRTRTPFHAFATILWTEEAVLQDLQMAGGTSWDSAAGEDAPATGGGAVFSFQAAALEVG